MRRNDWSYTCNININGYNIGYDTEKTLSTDDNATPNSITITLIYPNVKQVFRLMQLTL